MVGILSRRTILFSLFALAAAFPALAQPTISSSTPSAGATGVNETDDIVITLSQEIRQTNDSGLGNTSIDAVITLKITDATGADIPFNASINSTDDVVTIDPDDPLPSNTVIYVAIHDVENTSDQLISPNPAFFTFTTGDNVTPSITFNPNDGDNQVALATAITITFDELVRNTDASALDDTNVGALIELRETNGSGTIVPATVTINDPTNTIITITPNANLSPNMDYYVKLNPVEDGAGNTTSTETITFSTIDTQAPVITFTPADGVTGASTTNDITISFDEAVRRTDNSAITNGNVASLITLKLIDASGTNIPFTATINAGSTLITINPSSSLPDLTDIYVALAVVEDNFNNATTAASATFTTADNTDPVATFTPADNTADVPVTSNIVIDFNEAIRNLDNSPITNANVASLITLKLTNSGGTNVPFTATIDGTSKQITIDPTSDLSPNQIYYVALAPVEDAFDNATSTESITFTSEDTLPPVASFTPANGATGASNGVNIVITFNEAVRNLDNSALDDTNIDGKITLKITDATGADIPFDATINAGKTQVTINPTGALPDLTDIYVAISNVEDNYDNAITLHSITFETTDGTPPVVTFNPPDGFNGVAIGANIIITFDEPVRNTNNSDLTDSNIDFPFILLKTTDVTGADISFDASINAAKTQITVNPTSDLVVNQTYYLAIGSVEDNYNNATGVKTMTFTTQDMLVKAGSDRTICAGESTVLGESPLVAGGNGFYNIVWSSIPAGFSSNASTPTVSPTTTTSYICTVTDSDTNDAADTVTITVNTPTPAGQLAIQLTPTKARKTYLSTDDPVQLTYTLNGSPGVFSGNTHFEGYGVNTQGFFKYFYPNAANIGENVITLFYENAVGCITTKTDTARVVTPNGLIGGLDNLYCEVNQNDALVINEPGTIPTATSTYGYRYVYQGSITLYAPDNSIIAAGSSGYSVSGTNITINPGLLSGQKGTGYYYFSPIYDIEYLQYDPLNPSTPIVYYTLDNYSYFRIYFFVADKPDLNVSQISDVYCENESQVTLVAFPEGGTFKVNNSTSLALTTVGSKTFFDPGNAFLPNTFSISYEYTNSDGCFNSEAVSATVYRLPNLDFDFSDGCEGDTVSFIPTISGTNNIDEYQWQFGDRNSSDTLSGSSLGPIDHAYSIPDNYQVKLRYITNTAKQCTSEIEQVLQIGEIPTVDFTWRNVCEGDATTFLGTALNLGSSSIQSIAWDFEGGGYASGTINDSHLYTSTGSRPVKFKVNTNKNCSAETQKTVYTVPKVAATELPYIEPFNGDDGSWVAGISNTTPSSWSWASPLGYKLDGDAEGSGSAWFTNASSEANLHYNLNEKSWVHSPCLDLSEIERPVLSIDIRTLTQNNLDGAVIQMDSTNLTSSETTWKTVGTLKETPNWYDQIGLAGNPGSQALNQLGWSGSGDSTAWRTALIPLDGYLPKVTANRQKVRFRIAFGSQGSNLGKNLDGFAFDNFTIKERNRTVLLELFTNPSTLAANAVVDAFTLQPVTYAPKTEVIKLEYHLGTPMQDDIYTSNPEDPSARAIYYGVTQPPAFRIDASYENTGFSQWGANVYSQRTLKSAPATIDTIYLEQVGNDVKVHTEFTVLEDLARNTILHIVLVEKVVSANGNTYRYVVRKMLPDAAGTKYRDSLKISSQPVAFEQLWTPDARFITDPNQLAVVVFLQNEDTKEVYQARLRAEPNFIPALVTGVEPTFEEQVNIYPNPAHRELNIQLPRRTSTSLPITLTDNFGRAVYINTIGIGEQMKTISTSDFAAGIYILQITSDKGEIARKKVVVVNR